MESQEKQRNCLEERTAASLVSFLPLSPATEATCGLRVAQEMSLWPHYHIWSLPYAPGLITPS